MMESMLGEKILKFYCTESDIELFDDVKNYFTSDLLYNFTQIELLLQNDFLLGETKGVENLDYEKNLKVLQKLKPIYLESLNIAIKIPVNSIYFNFLGQWKFAVVQLKTVGLNKSETLTVESVLMLTAALEFALRNLYFTITKGKQPPHLLKDLLNAEELINFFGKGAFWFLKILMGTPKAVNLRNIVWHGFPKPFEIPEYFVSVLLIAVNTLGHRVESQKDFNLMQRPQIDHLSRHLQKFEKYVQTEHLLQDVSDAVYTCNWLRNEFKIYWQQLFAHFISKKWWKFVILSMPQIELLLRLIYAQANSYDVSAKLNEYYITMDTIFESHIPNDSSRPNVLLSSKTDEYLSAGCLKFIYDLFIAPQGPRLRDKVSHGEIALDCINNSILCSILLQLSLSLLNYNRQKCALVKYENQFHLNSLAKQSLNSSKMFLLSLLDLPLNTKFHFSTTHEVYLKNPISINIDIFQRHVKEPEVMNLVLKSSQSIVLTCRNYKESVTERLEQLQLHELHSKRRKTLEKMLSSLPIVWKALCSIVNCLEVVYVSLHHEDTEIFERAEQFSKILRFLKHTLKFSENFIKYSSKENNEWIKALELCKRFEEIRQRYFDERLHFHWKGC